MAKIFALETVLIDTGVIYALADRKDAWHKRVAAFMAQFNGKLVVPSTVIPEASYLLNTYLGQTAELTFLNALAEGEIAVEPFITADLARCIELLKNYGDANIGLVDASLIAMSERLKITRILTTDRRHFSLVRPKHCKGFDLLP